MIAAIAAERQARRRRRVVTYVALAHAAALVVFAGMVAWQPRPAPVPATPMFVLQPPQANAATAATYATDQLVSASVELRAARAVVRQAVPDLLQRPGEAGVRDRSLGVASLLGPRSAADDHAAV